MKNYLRLENFNNQQIIAALNILIKATLRRCETLDHCLFVGNHGTTWLAKSVAYELGANIHTKYAKELNTDSLMNVLTNLNQGDVFLIKNIHELTPNVAESLYRATKDFQCPVIIGKGTYQRVIGIDLPRFTLIGTAPRADLLLSFFRDAFTVYRLDSKSLEVV